MAEQEDAAVPFRPASVVFSFGALALEDVEVEIEAAINQPNRATLRAQIEAIQSHLNWAHRARLGCSQNHETAEFLVGIQRH